MANVLVIATHNRKKAGEMVQIIQARFPGLEVRTLADYPSAPEPEETGTTYAENAAIKSESGVKATGQWCVADDAGLEIDGLEGAPGLYSKRFGGEDLPFPEKMALILNALEGMPPESRRARFRCCVSFSAPGVATETFEATCEGSIADAPRGQGGFGYDPIFLPDDAPGRAMAELTAEEKHQISHRGKVLAMFAEALPRLIGSA